MPAKAGIQKYLKNLDASFLSTLCTSLNNMGAVLNSHQQIVSEYLLINLLKMLLAWQAAGLLTRNLLRVQPGVSAPLLARVTPGKVQTNILSPARAQPFFQCATSMAQF